MLALFCVVLSLIDNMFLFLDRMVNNEYIR
jgi:hypothetical protein